jgi:ethanolamine ammonia-lyase small subunit
MKKLFSLLLLPLLLTGCAGGQDPVNAYRTVGMDEAVAMMEEETDYVILDVRTPEEFAQKNGLIPLQTCCENKDQYLTRPDLGRKLNEESQKKLRAAVSQKPRVQLVIGDGLSSAAILANGLDCMAAIRDGLKVKGIETGQAVFIRYCRVWKLIAIVVSCLRQQKLQLIKDL